MALSRSQFQELESHVRRVIQDMRDVVDDVLGSPLGYPGGKAIKLIEAYYRGGQIHTVYVSGDLEGLSYELGTAADGDDSNAPVLLAMRRTLLEFREAVRHPNALLRNDSQEFQEFKRLVQNAEEMVKELGLLDFEALKLGGQSSGFRVESRPESLSASPNVERLPSEEAPPLESKEIPQYVTLDQMAAIVSRSKRTLEKALIDKVLPEPDVQGGGGRPHEWKWVAVRPILQEKYGRDLPRRFPGDKFRDGRADRN